MSRAEAIEKCQDLGKIVAYAAYDLGVCIPIGLVRTIIATCYIAKHAIYAELYQDIHNAKMNSSQKKRNQWEEESIESSVKRKRENREAERETRKTKGWFNKKIAKDREIRTKGKNMVRGGFGDGALGIKKFFQNCKDLPKEIKNESIQDFEKERREAWYAELTRGISEMLWIGGPYHTYTDNFSKHHKVSPLGLKELYNKVQEEDKFDERVEKLIKTLKELGFIAKDVSYNPFI